MKNKLKILHLEDTSFDMELVERELKKGGLIFDKIVVDNKIDFEKGLTDFLPDIVLSDHSLPSFDSSGALELVKTICPDVPFILVTATVSEEFAVNILKRGAADYILKTNMSRLPSAVIGAIEKSKIVKEKEIAEEELKNSYTQLRNLASHLQDIREEERASMAREIHDELGQQLTGLKLDCLWLSLKIPDSNVEVKEKVKVMESLLNTTLSTVKKIATELHPALLERLGFVEAIKWKGHEFEKRTGIKIDLTLPVNDIDISHKTSIALFRIFQESLTNIARHSGAKNVHCSLQNKGNEIFLDIKDDGKGFDVSAIQQMKSLGLLGIKERTLMLEGTYEIDSKPGKGTKISVVLPFTEK
ncbi:MAG: histidine kinase [Bacteroidota bacterium]